MSLSIWHEQLQALHSASTMAIGALDVAAMGVRTRRKGTRMLLTIRPGSLLSAAFCFPIENAPIMMSAAVADATTTA